MYEQIYKDLRSALDGDVHIDEQSIEAVSTDYSNFRVMPKLVVYPKHGKDIQTLVSYVTDHAADYPDLSVTARSAGIDETGGPLNESIIMDTSRYMNEFIALQDTKAIAQPGLQYTDFDAKTSERNLREPVYPASKDLCSIGGMVGNNAGGEKSLAFGKVADFVEELKVILRDGNEYTFRALSKDELEIKLRLDTTEGEIYREVKKMIDEHKDVIEAARPHVSKNSAGYALWDIWDGVTFDMTRLFTGSQGTLGLISEITFRLVEAMDYQRLVVVYLDSSSQIAKLTNICKEAKPEELELYHESALKMIFKHFPDYLNVLNANPFAFGYKFLPEVFTLIKNRTIPRFVIISKYTGKTIEEASEKAENAKEAIDKMGITTHLTDCSSDIQKYAKVRGETFYFFQKELGGKTEMLFFDDTVVPVEKLTDWVDYLLHIAEREGFDFFLTGHIGNGNLHFVPFLDIDDPKTKEKVKRLWNEIHDKVLEFGGSITGEHNDGLTRTPLLERMFGSEVYGLFAQTKHIFDPEHIFNPGKKIGAKDLEYALNHLKSSDWVAPVLKERGEA